MSFRLLASLLVLCFVSNARAIEALSRGLGHPVQASLVSGVDAVVPGQSFWIGLHFKIQPHWHTYWINPGDTGTRTHLTLDAPGLAFGPLLHPLPERFVSEDYASFGYENEVLHLIRVTADKGLSPKGTVTIKGHATWLVCKQTCIKGKADFTLELPVATKTSAVNEELFTHWHEQLPQAPTSDVLSIIDLSSFDSSQRRFDITWAGKVQPKHVDWLPIATDAIAVEGIKLSHQGKRTSVSFDVEVFNREQIKGGRLDGVIVWKDPDGRRRGTSVSVRVLQP